MSSKGAKDEDIMIAADLTLYANPLRHLTQNTRKETEVTEAKQENTPVLKSDIVAADLVKYGSPLDDRLIVNKKKDNSEGNK